MMQNIDFVELNATTSYSSCNINWRCIFATSPDAEVVLHHPIDDHLFQTCPKLSRPFFRFRVACMEGVFYVSAYKSRILDVVVVVTSTTICIPADQTLDQADEVAKCTVDQTIEVSSWACIRCAPAFVFWEERRRDVCEVALDLFKEELIAGGIGLWSGDE